ncbi:hypothetical protein [Microbispora sp. NPDC049633]|uniref:hypothetical protein n=1 Tax=Microbispora sp. NPDC049633 TaxID=3154355 RepID=UPI003421295A
MATYPTGFRTFTTKRDFSQTIFESHVNDIQDELFASQTVLGINPQISTRDPGNLAIDYTTVADRLQAYLRGEQLPYYQGGVLAYPLTPGNTSVPPPTSTPKPPQSGGGGCAGHESGRQWFPPIHSRSHTTTPISSYLKLVNGILTPLDDGPSIAADEPGPGRYRSITTGKWWQADVERDNIWQYLVGDDWDPDDHQVGLPQVDDDKTTEDGRWWRLPLAATADPYTMHWGDGIILNETGLWSISLRVDGVPTTQTRDAKAIRQARLEIDGKDVMLRHRLREHDDNGDFLVNTVHWTEILPRGTAISASARIDGPGLTTPVPINAYLRVQLVRCIDNPNPDGGLADAPTPIYTPPPPPPRVVTSSPSSSTTPKWTHVDSTMSVIIDGNGNATRVVNGPAIESPPGSGHYVGAYDVGSVRSGGTTIITQSSYFA